MLGGSWNFPGRRVDNGRLHKNGKVQNFVPEKKGTKHGGSLLCVHHHSQGIEKHEKFSSNFIIVGDVQHMGVSKNRGTPNWMVYNRKPY